MIPLILGLSVIILFIFIVNYRDIFHGNKKRKSELIEKEKSLNQLIESVNGLLSNFQSEIGRSTGNNLPNLEMRSDTNELTNYLKDLSKYFDQSRKTFGN